MFSRQLSHFLFMAQRLTRARKELNMMQCFHEENWIFEKPLAKMSGRRFDIRSSWSHEAFNKWTAGWASWIRKVCSALRKFSCFLKQSWHLEHLAAYYLKMSKSEQGDWKMAFHYLPQGFSCDTFHNPVPSICHSSLHNTDGLRERLREWSGKTLRKSRRSQWASVCSLSILSQ